MKYIKKFETIDIFDVNDYTVEDKLYSAILNHKNDELQKLINQISNINYQRDLDKITFLMSAAINNNMMAFDLLVKAGADWNIENMDGWDVLELIEQKNAKKIIKKYPEEYDLYLAKKDTVKYNI